MGTQNTQKCVHVWVFLLLFGWFTVSLCVCGRTCGIRALDEKRKKLCLCIYFRCSAYFGRKRWRWLEITVQLIERDKGITSLPPMTLLSVTCRCSWNIFIDNDESTNTSLSLTSTAVTSQSAKVLLGIPVIWFILWKVRVFLGHPIWWFFHYNCSTTVCFMYLCISTRQKNELLRQHAISSQRFKRSKWRQFAVLKLIFLLSTSACQKITITGNCENLSLYIWHMTSCVHRLSLLTLTSQWFHREKLKNWTESKGVKIVSPIWTWHKSF